MAGVQALEGLQRRQHLRGGRGTKRNEGTWFSATLFFGGEGGGVASQILCWCPLPCVGNLGGEFVFVLLQQRSSGKERASSGLVERGNSTSSQR